MAHKDNRYTVVITAKNKSYKIAKVSFYSNGNGFSIFSPYIIENKKMHLIKVVADKSIYEKHNAWVKVFDEHQYTSENRVKLSYHHDGFVQFSGEFQGTVISGRDQNTGEPKGLGIISAPLNVPITTGPSVALSVWHLDGFKEFNRNKNKNAIIFNDPEDTYAVPEINFNTYLLEFFVFTRQAQAAITQDGDKQQITMAHPFYREEKNKLFNFRVIPDTEGKNDYLLCMIIRKVESDYAKFNKSGFSLHSPSQIKDGKAIYLMAVYPKEAIPWPGHKKIDYVP